MPYYLTRTWSDFEMQRRALWVTRMMGDCQKQAVELGISTECVVGQPALECGWGAHVVGRHNLYGIKAQAGDGWTGARVLVWTFEYLGNPPARSDMQDWFRDYPDFGASVDDHLAFLKRNSRYAAAGVFDRKGDENYCMALERARYATAPNYGGTLISMRDTIREYFLPWMTTVPGQPVAVDTTMGHRWLMMGMHGTDVADLQLKIGMAPAECDGWFGAHTRAAVIDWQGKHDLQADGVVGSLTATALHL